MVKVSGSLEFHGTLFFSAICTYSIAERGGQGGGGARCPVMRGLKKKKKKCLNALFHTTFLPIKIMQIFSYLLSNMSV